MMKLSNLAAILSCLCLALGLTACVEDLGGDGSGDACTSDADCSNGQRCFRQGEDQFCVTPCATDNDCSGGDTCQGGACLPGDDGNNDAPNNDGNNDAPNNDAPNNDAPNNDAPNNDIPGGACADACNQLFDCLGEICGADILAQIEDRAGCIADCEADPAGFQPEQITALNCDELNGAICQGNPDLGQVCECPGAGPNDTNAGSACAADGDCQGGNLQAFCIPAEDQGEATGFEGGYCAAVGCQGDESCGEGNACVQLQTEQGPANFCLGGCVPADGRSVCRGGYGCWDIVGDGSAGVCFPECTGDDECGEGAVCDAGTGGCIAAQ